ncbi:MAG TPA: DUF1206 domain-containing protein [Gemmatimonadales bacterium]|nr:DUF1206 domain-containing protein [Gemmatimonadales bacterium]
MEDFARAGYLAKGVVYLLIGLLAFQAAAGAGGAVTGPEGAFFTLLQQPLGRVLLGLTAVGLSGYAVWRLFCAAFDPERREEHVKRIFVRIGYAGSGLAHAALALEAGRLALGRGGGGGGAGERAESWTARVLDAPLGPWIVGAVAIGIAVYGVAQIVRGMGRKVEERLRLGELAPDERRLVIRVGRVGHVARGIVFGIIGVLLMRAALDHNPQEAGGLGDALATLARQPYSPFLLGGVALGLAAYGAYQLVKARYRVIAAG